MRDTGMRMRTVAICCAEFAGITRWAAGVEPLLPPFPEEIPGCELLYVDVHGAGRRAQGADSWWCEGSWKGLRWRVATPDLVRGWDLEGAVVFSTACFLGDEGSVMREALLEAGARAVIAGAGVNLAAGAAGPGAGGSETRPYGWARAVRPAGAALLGRWLRLWMGVGAPVERALSLARLRMRIAGGAGARDALGFKVFWTGLT